MRIFALTLTMLALAPMLALAGQAGDVESVSLTVYNNDLALIREVRPLQLSAGTQTVTLYDVSGQLRPDTVHLQTPGDLPISLLEQNYDYDLVSRDKLLQRFIGKEIQLVNDTNNSVITGTLLSVASGIVLNSDGRILLDPPGRVVLPPGAADDLLLRPTLSWMLDSPQAANTKAEVSYLSGGLSWEAAYVLMLAADEKTAGLEGWVTLSNYSGTTYNNADLKLVAGEVNRVPDYKQMDAMAPPAPAMESAARGGGFQEESFFEYHLYDLQRQTTIRNNQQKQIGLLTAPAVPVTKVYEFNGQSGGPVRVTVEFENKDANGLGMPLPEGTVRVFKADKSGSAQFAGEDRIKHTPREEKVRLFVGNAFDIVGEATQTDYKDLGKGYEQSFKVELRNRKKDEAVSVKVVANLSGEWQVLSSNYDYAKKDANTAEFTVPVPADSTATLNYKVRVTWQ